MTERKRSLSPVWWSAPLALSALALAHCGPDPYPGPLDPSRASTGEVAPLPCDGLTECAQLQQITDALTEVMITCPHRLWPGYSWQRKQLLLVDNTNKEALLWNDQSDGDDETITNTVVDYQQVTQHFKGMFGFGQWREQMTFSLSASGPSRSAPEKTPHPQK